MAQDKKTHAIEEEKNLIRRYIDHGDMQALGELHNRFGGLINNIIEKYRGSGIPMTALRTHSQELFDQYVKTYDVNKGSRPSTWLQSNIQSKIKRYAASYHSGRLPESHAFLVTPIRTAEQDLKDEGYLNPTDAQVADRANVFYREKKITEQDVWRVRNSSVGDLPASTTIGDYGDNTGITLGDTAFESIDPEDLIRESAMIHHATMLVNGLPEPNRSIVLHHFGVGGYEKLSLRALAIKFGKNKHQIQKHIEEALAFMKDKGGSGL